MTATGPSHAGRRARRLLVTVVGILLGVFVSACDAIPPLPPNPFRTTPVVVVPPTPTIPLPTVAPTETPVPFVPYWVKNHREADMWSGQARESGVVSFGTTSEQFCVFRVEQPQTGSRLYVLNPYSGGHFWIDADAVGPVSEEPRRVGGPKPEGQNCADAIYTD